MLSSLLRSIGGHPLLSGMVIDNSILLMSTHNFEVFCLLQRLNTELQLNHLLQNKTNLKNTIQTIISVQHQHPYCAKSPEQWLSWNIGRRRASEVSQSIMY